MIDAGYFAKRVFLEPDWLKPAKVLEICSVSHCISKPADGWTKQWLHNGLGWFNRIGDAVNVVPADERDACRLFAYRLHPEKFPKGDSIQFVTPSDVRPDPIPDRFRSLGFDVASKSMESILGFECSPLSCNSMAVECEANEFCLFSSLRAAIAGARRFAAEQPERGDYYVIEVLEGPMPSNT